MLQEETKTEAPQPTASLPTKVMMPVIWAESHPRMGDFRPFIQTANPFDSQDGALSHIILDYLSANDLEHIIKEAAKLESNTTTNDPELNRTNSALLHTLVHFSAELLKKKWRPLAENLLITVAATNGQTITSESKHAHTVTVKTKQEYEALFTTHKNLLLSFIKVHAKPIFDAEPSYVSSETTTPAQKQLITLQDCIVHVSLNKPLEAGKLLFDAMGIDLLTNWCLLTWFLDNYADPNQLSTSKDYALSYVAHRDHKDRNGEARFLPILLQRGANYVNSTKISTQTYEFYDNGRGEYEHIKKDINWTVLLQVLHGHYRDHANTNILDPDPDKTPGFMKDARAILDAYPNQVAHAKYALTFLIDHFPHGVAIYSPHIYDRASLLRTSFFLTVANEKDLHGNIKPDLTYDETDRQQIREYLIILINSTIDLNRLFQIYDQCVERSSYVNNRRKFTSKTTGHTETHLILVASLQEQILTQLNALIPKLDWVKYTTALSRVRAHKLFSAEYDYRDNLKKNKVALNELVFSYLVTKISEEKSIKEISSIYEQCVLCLPKDTNESTSTSKREKYATLIEKLQQRTIDLLITSKKNMSSYQFKTLIEQVLESPLFYRNDKNPKSSDADIQLLRLRDNTTPAPQSASFSSALSASSSSSSSAASSTSSNASSSSSALSFPAKPRTRQPSFADKIELFFLRKKVDEKIVDDWNEIASEDYAWALQIAAPTKPQ